MRADLGDASATISIPTPNGKLERFSVVESPVMEPALAAKVPSFKSYSVKGIDDPTAAGRIDISSIGFHASIRSDRGVFYVDPAYKGDTSTYVTYKREALKSEPRKPEQALLHDIVAAQPSADELPAPGSVVQRRTYRFALVSDPKYAAYFGEANVDAAKAALINRTNEIYNDDLGFFFVLVANNDLLNFDTQSELTGACGVGEEANCYQPTPITFDLNCGGGNLEANQLAVDNVIGDANYDIGHFVSTGQDGGLASQGAGETGMKARGCSGLTEPTGDILAVEFFSHEVGHQFGAAHAFNAWDSCAPNRSAVGAIEPGSGSSVMSYAGVCGIDNIQDWSDPYFNQFSINQMQDYVNSTIVDATNGGTVSTHGNHSPVVTTAPAHAIPPRTPFTLTGSATDEDSSDTPVYIWEQNDHADTDGTVLTDNVKLSGPIFRIFGTAAIVPTYESAYNAPGESVAKTTDNTRTFPDIAQIVAGNTNAATGVCPTADPTPTPTQVECFSEFLPTTARTMHFSLTARDRHALGGGYSIAETTVTVAGTTPFAVRNPTSTAVQGNRPHVLSWDTAGTMAPPISVANVRVLYSTDGGLTFPTVVSASTPNDGSESVNMPNAATTTGRFKVEAIGQPFFDISHADLSVTPNEALPGDPFPPDPRSTVFRPVVTGISSKLKTSKSGAVKLKISCVGVDPVFALPSTCDGKLVIVAKIKGKRKTIGSAKFSLVGGTKKTISVKLSSAAKKALKKTALKATVTGTVGDRVAKRAVTIAKRR